MSNDAEGEIFGGGIILGAICTSIFWLTFFCFSSEYNRKGNFYVANQQDGWVVRMDNNNGNSTNITAPTATPEAAAKLANDFNRTLAGHENK